MKSSVTLTCPPFGSDRAAESTLALSRTLENLTTIDLAAEGKYTYGGLLHTGIEVSSLLATMSIFLRGFAAGKER